MSNFDIPQHRPAYRILAEKGFFGPDCHLYQEGDTLVYDDEPNEDMEPLNDLARQRLTALYEKLDDEGRRVAEKNGRSFIARPRNLDGAVALATMDAKRVQLKPGDGGVPLMGSKVGKDRAARIQPTETPETGFQQKRGPGRPRKGTGSLSINS